MSESQVVIFELSKVRYGIDIINVQEIIRMVEVTPVTDAYMSLEGIINLRGQVIPIINLAHRLVLQKNEINHETRIIVVEINSKKIGLIVDRVLEVGNYSEHELEKVGLLSSGNSKYLKGIVKKEEHMWLLLDVKKVA